MEMINATLLVQAVHFFGAYYILKKLIFLPGVAVVDKEQKIEDLLHDSITEGHAAVEKVDQEAARHWRAWRQFIADKLPAGTVKGRVIIEDEALVLHPPELDMTMVVQQEKDLAQVIVKMVHHDTF